MLAAGLGKRMAPLTPSIPKPLLDVAGRSLLHHMLDHLAASGVKRVVVVVHHQALAVTKHAVAWDGKPRMRIQCVRQSRPRGTGHAVATAARHVKGDALVVMGDAVVDPAVIQGLADAEGFVLAAARVPDARRFGALKARGKRILEVREKPKDAAPGLVNAGLYRIPHAALKDAARLKPSPRGELELTDVVDAWAQAGDVAWIPATGWLDAAAPWDLLAANEAALPRRLDALLGRKARGGPGTIEAGVQVRGRLFVDAGAVVKSGTYVEGDVLVGAGAKVGPNAYIRGPTTVGRGCHVGAATEVKASVLMDRANAPHLNYVGDSVLGPDVNLGAGTKVANLKVTPGDVRAAGPDGLLDTGRRKFGVVLGSGVKTGVNCSLMPGLMVGDGALLGAGRVVSGWVPPGTRLL